MANKTPFLPASKKGHFDGLVDEGRYLRQSSLYKQTLPRTPSRQIRSLPTFKVEPRNLCNPWLLFVVLLFLCSCALYRIKHTTTNSYVRNYKQNMQNKPNFQKSQMNVNTVITMNYEQRTMNDEKKQTQFKPNTNPIQTQYKPNSKPNKPNFRANIILLSPFLLWEVLRRKLCF
jgi:hypothetical protein